MLSAKKKYIAFPPSFWCVCARGKQNPAGDAFEIEKGNGDVRDYNIRTAAAVVLYDTITRCTYSSLEPLVCPGAAYLVPGTVHASTQYTTGSEVRGSVSRVKLPVSRDYLIAHVTSRATPSSCDGGEGESQFLHGTWIHCEAPPCVESAVHAAVWGRGVSAPLPYTESHATLQSR